MYLKNQSMRLFLKCNREKRQERSNELGEVKRLGLPDLPSIAQLSHPPIYQFPTKKEGLFHRKGRKCCSKFPHEE